MLDQRRNADANGWEGRGLLRISGTIAQQSEVKQEDDGITQRVTSKAGVHLVKEITVVPRVRLAPYRTFREVEQPQSDFIFRVKNDPEKGNLCALFEADGGYWKTEAVNRIGQWLTNQLKGSLGKGLGDVPVIA